MRRYIAPLIIIVIGLLLLLNSLNVGPGVNWLWTGGLAVSGLIVLLVGGRTRRSFVAGLLLIGAGIASMLSQMQILPPATVLPILIMLLGVLMLASQFILKREGGSAD